VAGAAVTAGAAILDNVPSLLAQETHGHLTRGDAAILRWLAVAEIIESDLWLQYTELAGTQDSEVSTIASQQIPGYPSAATGGNSPYSNAISQLDEDMAQYIQDNTEDELTHETFINAFLVSKGAPPVSLDQFRTLPSSKATGANQIGRLTSVGNDSMRIFKSYDALGRTTQTIHKLDGTSYVTLTSYGYPQNPSTTPGLGRAVSSQSLPDFERVAYTYDALGRVTTASYDTGVCIIYSYDPNGNRLSETINVTTAGTTGMWGCFNWNASGGALWGP